MVRSGDGSATGGLTVALIEHIRHQQLIEARISVMTCWMVPDGASTTAQDGVTTHRPVAVPWGAAYA
jgi:hypothetical protein